MLIELRDNVKAIYARKSIYSDKSDSVETQINMCKEYILNKYGADEDITVYYDEGYTGANTKRPGFTRLLKDINDGKINMLVCYKIDRISRNVLDFSEVYNTLQKKRIEFVSVKEQIDTSTPLGRAMMYICSVFAQMERETIEERVKDNMIELAKSGKWPGGRPPLGYKLNRVIINGKKHTVLEPNEETIPLLYEIFDTFLSGYSLTGLETYFRKKGVKSINGKYLSSAQLYNILKNPQYVANEPMIYDYFASKGCIMVNEREFYDGKHGLLVYGRTSDSKNDKHTVNPPEKWTVAIGMHPPLIPAEKWLYVQAKFGQNLIDKTSKHKIGLLKGILKCKCGHLMQVKHKVDKTYNKVYDSYVCRYRTRGQEYCDMKSIPVTEVDVALLNILRDIKADKTLLYNYFLNCLPQTNIRKKEDILKDIATAQKKISNLMQTLQDNSDSTAAKYIIKEIENLDKIIIGYNYELREVSVLESEKAKKEADIDSLYCDICNYLMCFDTLSYERKTEFLKKAIKECIWDGQDLILGF